MFQTLCTCVYKLMHVRKVTVVNMILCIKGFVDCPSVTIDQLVNIVGISKDLLDQTCSTEHLMKIASRLPNWQKYAESLRLSDSQVQDIKTDPHLDTAMKAQRVLKMWHQANGFKASHRSIVDVSLQLKHVAFAESICRMVKG